MKQCISLEQATELNDKQAAILADYFKVDDLQCGDGYITYENEMKFYRECDNNIPVKFPLLNIGQMIEFLFNNKTFISMHNEENKWGKIIWSCEINVVDIDGMSGLYDELCDALWVAVKIYLQGVRE